MREIYIDLSPVPKPRMTQSDKWKKRGATTRYWNYKDALIWLCKMNDYQIGEAISIDFIVEMPKSWSKKKRQEFNGKPHQSKPDLDNFIKAFKDALCKDDSHIYYYGRMRKMWGEKGAIIIYENGAHI